MKIFNNIFLRKKILIYGLGKSGISSYKFLKNKSDVYLFDDNLKNKFKPKKKLIRYEQIKKINFDRIIISPGIDISNCKLSKFLKKNSNKIYTDLDIFFSFFKNQSIAITGTNGKSTTAITRRCASATRPALPPPRRHASPRPSLKYRMHLLQQRPPRLKR